MFFFVINYIRGLSSLLIIIYHLSSKLLPNGYLGVDQFYIISGFLIIFSIFHNNHKSFSILSFILKRAKRLLPIKCVVLYYVLILNKMHHIVDTIYLEENSISAFLSFYNFKLINDNSNYFSFSNDNLILNFWSLSVEEQYYLYIAFFSSILIHLPNCLSLLFHLFTIFLSYIFFQNYYYKYYIFSFYSIYTRLWEFGSGSIVYYYNNKLINKFVMNVCVYLQIFLMFCNIKHYICFISINIITIFQVLYSKYYEDCIISNNILNFIGKISYSIYLVHYSNILIFCKSNAILFTIIFSIIIYYSVEKPFRNTTHDYLLVLFYIFCVLLYYKIYKIDYKFSIQKNIEKYFIKDMCSYDILDNILLSNYKILLLGDSHVIHYIRALYDNKNEAILYHSYIHNMNMYNRNYNDILYLLKYKFDLIVISFYQEFYRNSTYENEIFSLINKINNLTNNILVISDNPYHKLNPNGCLFSSKYCYGIVDINCSVITHYSMSKYNYSKNINVYDFNTNKYTIKGNKCIYEINGLPVYRDIHHFNGIFVEKYLMKDIHLLLNRILDKKIYSTVSISTLKYHCLEEEHNICRDMCKKNNYKIKKIKNKYHKSNYTIL